MWSSGSVTNMAEQFTVEGLLFCETWTTCVARGLDKGALVSL